ncbi:hypothetical protein ACDZ28_04080 [Paenibacillus sp. RS8]|uniref:hypothetical protein n=1 Tax=Paenibacillus sp. RS8 TaxID=3242681 RepID=UPI0035C263B8
MEKMPRQLYVPPRQPEKCRSCLWGEWTGTKQFCSRLECQRNDMKRGDETAAQPGYLKKAKNL